MSPGYAIAERGCIFCVRLFYRFWPVSRLGIRVFLQPSFATTRTEIRMVISLNMMNSEKLNYLVRCDTPNGYAGGGIWQAGKGLASDGTYIYLSTGNGDFNVSCKYLLFFHCFWKHNTLTHATLSLSPKIILKQYQITVCACSR